MLETTLCGITLKNPVIAASGTFGFGAEYSEFFDVSRLGGICTKGLTLHPREGNPGLRVWETPAGMMNSVGLQNPGIPVFLERELPRMRTLGTAIIANIGGGDLEEYIEGVRLLSNVDGVDIIELNISCPNVREGGMAFGIKCDVAASVVAAVRPVCAKPLMVKLSPNAEDITAMAVACEQAGADAVSLVNTFKALAIDIHARKAVFDNVTAGLSGPCIKPIALRMVWEVANAIHIPVVGIGGIATWQDALEFIMAGATAVQVGTATFIKPTAMLDIVNGLEHYCADEHLTSLATVCNILGTETPLP
ncbi:dihydroorotate dehydrogenase [Candidatus Cryosericum odellii]|jgi:dihydroorotate dehydrogenase (NAD+) catalytic subunit|uniref:Dihydroorotate dehydrogenase n=1 Tax=Candidatus Cryosericum odellii TaxID=2290917 RepID=A0A398D6A7_9BACT|nr:dihydroorotate dehydrogenase [Candidatus Cryosericum odellii]RIE10464.1 dihydroorotate dehydrogenase [Candidatus Cryosericum odellii]RIE10822.1 dihydroorotate dehydrogenase [Candidatus Cryosericum odellii]